MSVIDKSLNGVPPGSPDVASAVSLYGNVSSSRLDLEDADIEQEYVGPNYSTDNLSTMAVYEVDLGSLDDPTHQKSLPRSALSSRTSSKSSIYSAEGKNIQENNTSSLGRGKLGNGLTMSPYSVNFLSTLGDKKCAISSDGSSIVSSQKNFNADNRYVPRCHSPLAHLDGQQHNNYIIYPSSPDQSPVSLKEKMHLLNPGYIINNNDNSRFRSLEKRGNNHSIESFASELDSNTAHLQTFHTASSTCDSICTSDSVVKYSVDN